MNFVGTVIREDTNGYEEELFEDEYGNLYSFLGNIDEDKASYQQNKIAGAQRVVDAEKGTFERHRAQFRSMPADAPGRGAIRRKAVRAGERATAAHAELERLKNAPAPKPRAPQQQAPSAPAATTTQVSTPAAPAASTAPTPTGVGAKGPSHFTRHRGKYGAAAAIGTGALGIGSGIASLAYNAGRSRSEEMVEDSYGNRYAYLGNINEDA